MPSKTVTIPDADVVEMDVPEGWPYITPIFPSLWLRQQGIDPNAEFFVYRDEVHYLTIIEGKALA